MFFFALLDFKLVVLDVKVSQVPLKQATKSDRGAQAGAISREFSHHGPVDGWGQGSPTFAAPEPEEAMKGQSWARHHGCLVS